MGCCPIWDFFLDLLAVQWHLPLARLLIEALFSLFRYKLYGPDIKWPFNELTYKVYKYPNHANSATRLTNTEVDAIIKSAADLWEEVANLKIRKDVGEVHIDIAFEKGGHGDGDSNNFDGPLGDLAHAFRPADYNFYGSYTGLNQMNQNVELKTFF